MIGWLQLHTRARLDPQLVRILTAASAGEGARSRHTAAGMEAAAALPDQLVRKLHLPHRSFC